MDATTRSAPTTCPFLAFGDDRQHRADAPDPRHRCHASITPTQIPLSHQERFCLEPAFPGCPVFREWAAAVGAAGPGGRPGAGGITPGLAAGPAAIMGASGSGERGRAEEAAPTLDPDQGFGWTAASDAASPARASSDDPAAVPRTAGPPGATSGQDPAERYAPPSRGGPAMTGAATGPVVPQGRISPDAAVLAAGPRSATTGPAALAGPPREGPPAVAGGPQTPPGHVPSAAPIRRLSLAGDMGRGGTHRTRRGVLPALAGLAGLFLLFFLLPVLLGGGRPGGPPGTTATPGGTTATVPGTATTSAAGTTEPTGAPTATPTPRPTRSASAAPSGQGRIYTVQPGDTFCGIARRFGVSSAELLAANPDVTNPDRIQAGQQIRIPAPGTVSPRPGQSAPPC